MYANHRATENTENARRSLRDFFCPQDVLCVASVSSVSPWLAYVIHDPAVSTEIKAKAGLEDIVATSSSICYIDGERGILAYRGYDIHDLAPHATFEEVCYLLWHGQLPNRAELGDLQSQFAAGRALPEGVIRLLRQLPPGAAMDTLRTAASALSHYDRDAATTRRRPTTARPCASPRRLGAWWRPSGESNRTRGRSIRIP